MAAGYVIAQLKVTNPENYKEYAQKIPDNLLVVGSPGKAMTALKDI